MSSDIIHQKLTKKAIGVRLRPRHQEEIRTKIQATQILKVIQSHVLEGTEIAASRIHAGLKLLDKVLPNAIPEAIEANQQAQALQAIQDAQLKAMALEQLRALELKSKTIDQEPVLEDTVLLDSSTHSDIETIPLVLPDSLEELEQSSALISPREQE